MWLASSTWRQELRSSHDAHTLDVLDDWIAKGRCAVARRREVDTRGAVDDCALALALPLAQGRTRIAFIVDMRAIVRIAQPLRLDEVLASGPAAWRNVLGDLVARGAGANTSFHVYGSLAWQHITREPCVTPDSDVDLLWAARDASHIERTLALLVDWERESGLRADGELLLPDGGACAWRELLRRPERVLVKTDAGVVMGPSPLPPAKQAA